MEYPDENITLNNDDIDTTNHKSYQIILPAVAVTIVIIAIIFGNSLVCIAIWKIRSLKGIQNWFLFSLAISDLMVGVLIMPFGIVNKLLGTWVFGSIWCQAWKCLDVNACSASILNLCLISVDRYFSIIKAVKYTRWRNAFRAKVMIASVWILSALISLPPLFGWQGNNDDEGSAVCRLSDNKAYIIYSTLCSFFIPAFIMVYIYIRIWFAAKKHARTSIRSVSAKTKKTKKGTYEMANNATDQTCVDQLEPTSGGSDEVEPPSSPQESSQTDNNERDEQEQPKWKWEKNEEGHTTPGRDTVIDKDTKVIGCDKTALVKEGAKDKNGLATENGKHVSKESEIDRQKRKLAQTRERRATLVLGIIMGGFILSWYPFFQLYFITAICEKCHFPDLLFAFFEWIGYCNSAINPLIYTFFNRDFRKAFKKLLGCGR
ncbi:alpha-2C adrenergic receptor-like [Antedon mediterranea]|uniref:alpha-2C adrenergic receptor-like n=1 Tax=Antedon mediterranea TaxID=105859 RepID=UPI003AF94355